MLEDVEAAGVAKKLSSSRVGVGDGEFVVEPIIGLEWVLEDVEADIAEMLVIGAAAIAKSSIALCAVILIDPTGDEEFLVLILDAGVPTFSMLFSSPPPHAASVWNAMMLANLRSFILLTI
ncbi:Putative uncharacterized protein [Mycoavidus cysteinexigens]|uniref:Uncharacterized protein n=1 Tax=Mycoavidus cysteinexigens TaxID=1553431 RepID=A0A2Z6ETT8_9BURK|nr:Putative uncharacterized protein [Mycoavidus cysteinexigens]GLR02345.1 hypothetical protein GCM10007934_21620 [Mycoavidus cysteinexigens]